MTKRGTQPKQKQHRLKHRAQHGSPIYSERVAAWVSPDQRSAFWRYGGSAWLRGVMEAAMKKSAWWNIQIAKDFDK